jgi:RimJ/RimL family protein N-acetyltransferase
MILYGCDNNVAQWVAARIPHVGANAGFGPMAALGVVRNGKIAGGVVFHDWQPDYGTIQVSCAADSPRWATRRTVAELLRYPFRQLGASLVWAAVPERLERPCRFIEGIGFQREPTLRDRFGSGDGAAMFSMSRAEWREQYEG